MAVIKDNFHPRNSRTPLRKIRTYGDCPSGGLDNLGNQGLTTQEKCYAGRPGGRLWKALDWLLAMARP